MTVKELIEHLEEYIKTEGKGSEDNEFILYDMVTCQRYYPDHDDIDDAIAGQLEINFKSR